MIWVTEAKYLGDYNIELKFSDTFSGKANLEKTILEDGRPIFAELKDINKFSKFKVDMDTLIWENGLDLAPEYLYSLAKSN